MDRWYLGHLKYLPLAVLLLLPATGCGGSTWNGGAVRATAQSTSTPAQRSQRQARELAELAEVRLTDAGLLVTLSSEEVAFGSGESELSAPSRELLLRLAAVLARYPEGMIVIKGHTDSSGSAGFNQRLSQRRAQAVSDILIEGGVSGGLIRIRGCGETQPMTSNETPAGRAANRRVELDIHVDDRQLSMK